MSNYSMWAGNIENIGRAFYRLYEKYQNICYPLQHFKTQWVLHSSHIQRVSWRSLLYRRTSCKTCSISERSLEIAFGENSLDCSFLRVPLGYNFLQIFPLQNLQYRSFIERIKKEERAGSHKKRYLSHPLHMNNKNKNKKHRAEYKDSTATV